MRITVIRFNIAIAIVVLLSIGGAIGFLMPLR